MTDHTGAIFQNPIDAKTIRKDFPIFIGCGSMDPVSNQTALAKKLVDFYVGLGLKPEYKFYKDARHEILNEINKDEVYADFGNFIDKIVK